MPSSGGADPTAVAAAAAKHTSHVTPIPPSTQPQPHSHPSPSPPPSDRPLITKFTNVTLLRNHSLVVDDLWVQSGRIIDPISRFWDAHNRDEALAADVVVDCKGLILAPGYIDLQLNGAFGVDFSNPDDVSKNGDGEGITRVTRGVTAHGVTSIYATIITSAPDTYAKLQPLVKSRKGSARRGAHILGLHLEGPFITVPGAHPPPLMRGIKHPPPSQSPSDSPSPAPAHQPIDSPFSPDIPPTTSVSPAPIVTSSSSSSSGCVDGMREVINVYGESLLSDARIVTLAPEIEGMDETVSTLAAPPYNITVSCGHSRSSFEKAMDAVKRGARLITHLFNAMSTFHHRDPGLIGLIGAPECREAQQSQTSDTSSLPPSDLTHPPPPPLFYSLIVDGHHAHPSSVNIAFHTHPRGAILVTDAMCAMGLDEGRYKFGEIEVDIRNNMAKVAGTNTLAGSIATMEQCVQNFKRFTGCSIVDALESASLHPAQCMRLREKGTLDVGMDADLILVDSQLSVHACWVMGELAWKQSEVRIIQQSTGQEIGTQHNRK